MAETPDCEHVWQFSLAFYPGVKSQCLYWQDKYAANINLLLFLCYLEQQQLSLTAAQIAILAGKLQPFNLQYTQVLRQLRRQLTHSDLSGQQQQQFKQALLHSELTAEKLEQQILLQHCPPLQHQPSPLLEHYAALLTVSASPLLQQQIIDLRQNL